MVTPKQASNTDMILDAPFGLASHILAHAAAGHFGLISDGWFLLCPNNKSAMITYKKSYHFAAILV